MFAFNTDNLMKRMFRRVDNVCWDMSTGGIGVKVPDGIATIALDKENPDDTQININMMEQFSMPIPAYATSVKRDDINVGDIIVSTKGDADASAKILGWVIKKNDKSFRLLKVDGMSSNWVPPAVTMMGFDSGILVLRSLVTMMGGEGNGFAQVQGNLMQMMMMSSMFGEEGEDTGDMMDNLMPMFLMSSMGLNPMTGSADAAAANPMGGMSNIMQMMMMSKMFGKGGKSPKIPGLDRDTSSKHFR